MSEATFTFRVDESLKTEFSTAAKARDRSSAQLLRDFMRDFVRQQEEAAAHDAWFRRRYKSAWTRPRPATLSRRPKWKPKPKPGGLKRAGRWPALLHREAGMDTASTR